MTEIKIFMEGGGDRSNTKAALRQGMDVFLGELKEAARNKAWRWKLIPCGDRQQTFDKFDNECRKDNGEIIVLLVDSENPVYSKPCTHLKTKDGWAFDMVAESRVHMMVQSMETWIAADANALNRYYGQKFLSNKLPTNPNLEEVPKQDIASSLEAATSKTQKGAYHKIWHASSLLGLIDSNVVRRKCPHCDRLFNTLSEIIAE